MEGEALYGQPQPLVLLLLLLLLGGEQGAKQVLRVQGVDQLAGQVVLPKK